MSLRPLVVLLAICAAVFGVATDAAAQDRAARISIAGSDTMNILSQRLAEEYMKERPGVEIAVRGGGSGVGVRAIIDGTADICQSSRAISEGEIQQARSNGQNPEEHVIGLDGLAVAVPESSPVDELTMGQIRAIFVGAIQRWSQLNPTWPDERIVLYARESNSGTYDYFKEYVLRGSDFASNTNYMAATAAVGTSTAGDRNGIGFGGVAYFVKTPGLKVLHIRRDRESPAVSPVTEDGEEINFAAVQDGSYPIARPLRYYTALPATGEIAAFLQWIKGPTGQRVVKQVEYIPILPLDADDEPAEASAETGG